MKTKPAYWLMKSEPESYSIDEFRKDKKTLWTGVRNYQARNFMMTGMKKNDEFIFYHSNAVPAAAVGVGRILEINQPDPTALDKKSKNFDAKASKENPIWYCAQVSYVGHLSSPVSLAEMRGHRDLSSLLLLKKGQRLSILPVSPEEFTIIVELGGGLK